MTTSEERKNQLLRAGEETKIATVWMASHVEDYVQSAKNAKVIGDFLDQNGLPFIHENLEKGFVWAKSFGWDFTKTNESAAPAVVPTPTPAATVVPAPPVAPAVPVEESLPEIPDWFPNMETNADLRAIPQEKFKELYFGKAGEKFKARLVAVK